MVSPNQSELECCVPWQIQFLPHVTSANHEQVLTRSFLEPKRGWQLQNELGRYLFRYSHGQWQLHHFLWQIQFLPHWTSANQEQILTRSFLEPKRGWQLQNELGLYFFRYIHGQWKLHHFLWKFLLIFY